MIRGGIADKLGNAYEAQWYAVHLLRVFTGRSASAITLEPLNTPGFEFSYETEGYVEWHQCKMRSNGSWTLTALKNEGVLKHIRSRLEQSDNNRCVLVSDANAQSFALLAKFADQALNFADFETMCRGSGKNENDLKELCTIWQADPPQAFLWLKRCSVPVISSDALANALDDQIEANFTTETSRVRDRLATLATEQLTRRLTTDDIRANFRLNAITARDFALDPTLGDRISHATSAYLDTVRAAAPPIRITSAQPETEIEEWYHNGSKQILFVAGDAGSGKSLTLANVAEDFGDNNIRVLAFRMDRYLDVSSAEALGLELTGEEVCPVIPLAQIEREGRPLLIIDQLDAVSSASGRRRKVKDLLLDLMRNRETTSNVRIIVACRAYDLAQDEDFQLILKEERADQIFLKAMDWETDIGPALSEAGYDASAFKPDIRQLLSIPIHLATYLKLAQPSNDLPAFSSGADLVDQLIEKVNVEVTDSGEGWSAWEALGKVADRMSSDQVLSAPVAVLDCFRNARHRLSSAGLIVVQGNRIQFAHESYFDLIFARRFHASGIEVHKWLTSSEQHLFRRTQVRQILEYLRSQEIRSDYLRALDDVLNGEGIRFHIRDAAARWLSSISKPSKAELDIILKAGSVTAPATLMRRAFGPAWFDLLGEQGIIDRWLSSDDDEVASLAMSQLSKAFEEDPQAAAACVRRFSASGHPKMRERRLKVARAASPGNNPARLVDEYSGLIDGMTASELEAEVYNLAAFYHWRTSHGPLALALIEKALRRWLNVDPYADPFIGDGMYGRQTPYSVQELAKIAPVEFVERIAPLYAEVLGRIARHKTEHDGRHADRLFTKSFRAEDRWGGLLIQTLTAAARQNPDCLRAVFDNFDADRSATDRLFILRAVAAHGQAGSVPFAELIDHAHLFDSDHDGDEWLPAADAAAAAKPFLSALDWERFENRLKALRPEHDTAKEALKQHKIDPEGWPNWRSYAMGRMNDTGIAAWRVMRRIGSEAFGSTDIIRYMKQLDRKFDGREIVRRGSGVRQVVSPISAKQAMRMSDTAWLRAMSHYRDDDRERRWKPGDETTAPGGARELAGVLEHLTRNDPERGVALLEKMPDATNTRYPRAILDGLRGNRDCDLILRALSSALPFLQGPSLFSLLLLAEGTPEIAREKSVFDLVAHLTVHGDDPSRSGEGSEDEIRGALKFPDLFDQSGKAVISGVGADRHFAWRTMARIADALPFTRNAIFDLLENRADQEDNRDVWASMVGAAVSALPHDQERAFSLLEKLAHRDIRLLTVFSVPQVYHWALRQDWSRFSWIIDRMLEADNRVLNAIGAEWLAARYFEGDTCSSRLSEICAASAAARRASVHVAQDYIVKDLFETRALEWLIAHVKDPDPDVVSQVFSCDWAELLDAGGPRLLLAEELLKSETFGLKAQRLIHALEDRAATHPDLALRTARKAIELALQTEHEEQFTNRALALHSLGRLISGAAEAYAERGAALNPALDLIDQYLHLDHYGVEQEILKYDARS